MNRRSFFSLLGFAPFAASAAILPARAAPPRMIHLETHTELPSRIMLAQRMLKIFDLAKRRDEADDRYQALRLEYADMDSLSSVSNDWAHDRIMPRYREYIRKADHIHEEMARLGMQIRALERLPVERMKASEAYALGLPDTINAE